ncbi:kinase-like domain-containing protein [Lophiotrema nucula]|uniref:non-specific serine/threonine protein kinase n=1 Tax=Lophiotrema nucula TaxID=690887 RepID=A0A6A5YMW8_9PLEO|nr:kinase-like domain-containing protein [Lophiotrema nucula]
MDSQNQAKTKKDSSERIDTSLAEIIPSQLFSHHIDDSIFYKVKELLDQHPDESIQAWSKNPRLYVLLRILGHEHGSKPFEKFSSQAVGDVWLPLPLKTRQELCKSADISPSSFETVQRRVLSDQDCLNHNKLPANISKHLYIQDGKGSFENIDTLGTGGSAEVAKVRHKASGQYFACKRIKRADNAKLEQARLKVFQQEVEVLQHVRHQHLVSLQASFTDLNSFSLILTPVAKDVLKFMLDRQSHDKPLPPEEVKVLRHTFVCLATAIAYLHEHKVRHKDIKPGNILLSDGRVRLCDFGISRDWSEAGRSTTEGQVFDFTRRYCAPEVLDRDPRNSSSDIWSLGCVYLEIITVIKGYTMEELNHFLVEQSDGASERQGLCYAHEAMLAWMVRIRDGDSADDLPLDWCTPMIRREGSERLKAKEILSMIVKQASKIPRPGLYIPRCCTRTDSMGPFEAFEGPTLSPSVSSVSSDEASTTPTDPGSSSKEDISNVPVSEEISTSLILEKSPELGFEPNCFCTAKSNEKQILECTFASCSLDPLQLTAETNPKCELSRNRVQVYETPLYPPHADGSQLPMLWWVTRRIAISYLSGSPELRRCTSFWVPLADMHSTIHESEVALHFSDCNQMRARRTGDWGLLYDWGYDGQEPNNTIHIRFGSVEEARRFLNSVRLPYEDGSTVKHGRHFTIEKATEQEQEVQVYDIGRERGIRNYRAATVTTANPTTKLSHSKLFMIWPEVDLHIQLLRRKRRARLVNNTEPRSTMIVTVGNVSTPIYNSNVRGKPAVDYGKIGRFKTAVKVKSAVSVLFPIENRLALCNPPSEVVELLFALTGWKLAYFSHVTTFKAKNKFFLTKKYGRADILLWSKESLPEPSAFQVTLRQHDEREFLWTSGTIATSTTVTPSSSSPLDATITVSNKFRGVLLDISSMTAITSERSSNATTVSNGPSQDDVEHSDSDGESKMVLSFEDGVSRQHFSDIICNSPLKVREG